MAQDEATTKFIDSLKNPPRFQDTAAMPAAVVDTAAGVGEQTDTTAAYDEETAMPVDTAINSVLRKINPDSIALIKKDRGFYYQSWLDSLLRAEDAKPKLRKEPVNPPDLSFLDTFFTIFKIVLWIIAVAVVVFVLYKLFLGKSALFLKGRKNIDAVIDLEQEQVPADRYEGLIKKAEGEKNYRLAVRYLHLQALTHLAEKGYIRIGTEKTNYQYTAELRNARPAIAGPFADLTYKYEYIWYGEYMVTDAMYTAVREGFAQFNIEMK
jgi:hypothetical protein